MSFISICGYRAIKKCITFLNALKHSFYTYTTTIKSIFNFRKITIFIISFLHVFTSSVMAAGVAPANRQTRVYKSENGVPVVDINNPNSSGLSHNQYNAYNVEQEGLVLNNAMISNGLAHNSRLAGRVASNANLSHEASIILNEVISSNQSSIGGYTEVLGSTADVVIANPNGITCTGCGFINTNRVTFTTGAPNINSDGSLAGFTVNRGNVHIKDHGANLSTQQQFDIVARSVDIDGNINLPKNGELGVYAGSNVFNYLTKNLTDNPEGDESSPSYALDSSALGGMYAGRIRIITTEDGVGVRMLGEAAASADDFVLTSDGNIEIASKVSAERDLKVSASTPLNNTLYMHGTESRLSAKGDLTLEAPSGQVRFVDSGLYAGGKLSVNASSLIDSSMNNAKRFSKRGSNLQITDIAVINGTQWLSEGLLNFIAPKLTSDALIQASDANITAETFDNNGILQTTRNLNLTVATVLNNNDRLVSGGDITVTGSDSQYTINQNSIMQASNLLSISGQENARGVHVNLASDKALLGGALNVLSGTLNIGNNAIVSSIGSMNIDVSKLSLSNPLSRIVAVTSGTGEANITIANGFSNSGAIHSNANLNLKNNNLTNTKTGGISALSTLTISGKNLSNSGALYAGSQMNLNFDNRITNASDGLTSALGTIDSGGDISITTHNFTNNSDIQASGHTTITSVKFNNETPGGDTRDWRKVNVTEPVEIGRSSNSVRRSLIVVAKRDEIRYSKTWNKEQYFRAGRPLFMPKIIAKDITIKGFDYAKNLGAVVSAQNKLTLKGRNKTSQFTNNDLSLSQQLFELTYETRHTWDEILWAADVDHKYTNKNYQTKKISENTYDRIGAGLYAPNLNASGFHLNNISSEFAEPIPVTRSSIGTTFKETTYEDLSTNLPNEVSNQSIVNTVVDAINDGSLFDIFPNTSKDPSTVIPNHPNNSIVSETPNDDLSEADAAEESSNVLVDPDTQSKDSVASENEHDASSVIDSSKVSENVADDLPNQADNAVVTNSPTDPLSTNYSSEVSKDSPTVTSNQVNDTLVNTNENNESSDTNSTELSPLSSGGLSVDSEDSVENDNQDNVASVIDSPEVSENVADDFSNQADNSVVTNSPTNSLSQTDSSEVSKDSPTVTSNQVNNGMVSTNENEESLGTDSAELSPLSFGDLSVDSEDSIENDNQDDVALVIDSSEVSENPAGDFPNQVDNSIVSKNSDNSSSVNKLSEISKDPSTLIPNQPNNAIVSETSNDDLSDADSAEESSNVLVELATQPEDFVTSENDHNATSVSESSEVSPSISIATPKNPNGFFVVSKNPTSSSLVETNPLFSVKSNFIGSNYMMRRYQYDPDQMFIRLGDANYEAFLIRQQLVSMTGQTFLEGYDDEELQMKGIMDNGLKEAKRLGLAYGKRLTPEQFGDLQEDILWMVSMDVSGKSVLVPRVYLAKKTLKSHFSSGAVIAAKNLDANLSSISNVGGDIVGTKKLKLIAKGNISNISGNITGGSVEIKSTSESVTSEIKSSSSGKGFYANTVLGKNASIESTGDLNIFTQQDFSVLGGSVLAGANADIKTGNDVIFDTIENKKTRVSHSTNRSFIAEKSTTTKTSTTKYIKPKLTVIGNLFLNSGKDITLAGTDTTIGGSGTIHAERNVNMINKVDVVDKKTKTTKTGWGVGGGLYGTENVTREEEAGQNVSSSMYVDGNLKLTSKDDITIQGASFDVKGGGSIISEQGDVNVLDGMNYSKKTEQKITHTFLKVENDAKAPEKVTTFKGKKLTMMGPKVLTQIDDKKNEKPKATANSSSSCDSVSGACNASASAQASAQKSASSGFSLYRNDQEETTTYKSNSVGSQLNFGKKLKLEANKDVILSGVKIDSKANVSISAENVQVLDGGEDIETTSKTINTTRLGLFAETDNIANAEAKAEAKARQYAGAQAKANALATASSDNKLNFIEHKEKSQNTYNREGVGSSINAGGDISIIAVKDITLKGANIEAMGNVDLEAENQKSYASESIHINTTTSSEYSAGKYANAISTAGASAEASAGALGANVAAEANANAEAGMGYRFEYEGKESLEFTKTGKATTIVARNNIYRSSRSEIVDQGTQLSAGKNIKQSAKRLREIELSDVSISRKRSLASETRLGGYATAYAGAESTSGTFGSHTDGSAGVGIGASLKQSMSDTSYNSTSKRVETVQYQSGGDIAFGVEEKTTLLGTKFESDGNLSIESGSLDYQAAYDTEETNSYSGSGTGEFRLKLELGDKMVGGEANINANIAQADDSSVKSQVGSINVLGAVTIKTNGDSLFEGTSITAGEKVDIASQEGAVSFNAATNESRKNTLDNMSNVALEANMTNVSVGVDVINNTSGHYVKKATAVKINAGSGGVRIGSKKDLTLVGTEIDTKGAVKLKSGGNIKLLEAVNEERKLSSNVGVDFSASRGGAAGKLNLDVVNKETRKGTVVKINATGDISLKGQNTIDQESNIKSVSGVVSKEGNIKILKKTNQSKGFSIGLFGAGAGKKSKKGKKPDRLNTDHKFSSAESTLKSSNKKFFDDSYEENHGVVTGSAAPASNKTSRLPKDVVNDTPIKEKGLSLDETDPGLASSSNNANDFPSTSIASKTLGRDSSNTIDDGLLQPSAASPFKRHGVIRQKRALSDEGLQQDASDRRGVVPSTNVQRLLEDSNDKLSFLKYNGAIRKKRAIDNELLQQGSAGRNFIASISAQNSLKDSNNAGISSGKISSNSTQEIASTSSKADDVKVGSACFTGETKVSTSADNILGTVSQGETKIQDIKVGEYVIATQGDANHVSLPSYDLMAITPSTWKKVDLSYIDQINGKAYPAQIQLLRPITWLQKHNMDQVGNKVTLSIPEFGIDNIYATVNKVASVQLNTVNIDWSKTKSRPVIGKFKRYASDVRTYRFKDSEGHIETINATPNHPFYVQNKQAFMPISQVSATDQLLMQSGEQVHLICESGKKKSCGKQYNHNSEPVVVYNLEVYRKHTYYVGQRKILVHNVYGAAAPSVQSGVLYTGLAGNDVGNGITDWSQLVALRTQYSDNCARTSCRIDQFLQDNTIAPDDKPDIDITPNAIRLEFNDFSSLDMYIRNQPMGFRGIIRFGRQNWNNGIEEVGHMLNVVSRGEPLYIDMNDNIIEVKNTNQQAVDMNTETPLYRHKEWSLWPTGFVRQIPYPQQQPFSYYLQNLPQQPLTQYQQQLPLPQLQHSQRLVAQNQQPRLLQYQQQQQQKLLQNQYLQNPYLKRSHVQYLLKHLADSGQQNILQNPHTQYLLKYLHNRTDNVLQSQAQLQDLAQNLQDSPNNLSQNQVQFQNLMQNLQNLTEYMQNPHLSNLLDYLQNPPELRNLQRYLQIPPQLLKDSNNAGISSGKISSNSTQEIASTSSKADDVKVGSACFTGETKVSTSADNILGTVSQGETKIQDIKVGEYVIATQGDANHVSLPSYDLMAITPSTWKKVDLSYIDQINGKAYPAQIQLLRPITWLQKHNMDQVGNKVTLSIPEFGIDNIYATVNKVASVQLNTVNIDWSKTKSRPVIGKFKRYASDVRTYRFKDSEGHIETINATPNHPFYVQNKQAFMPISQVSATDQLLMQSGEQVHLICESGKKKSCGKQYNHNSEPVVVYNLEVYRKHTYYVGQRKILVHNVYFVAAPSIHNGVLYTGLAGHGVGNGITHWSQLDNLGSQYDCNNCARNAHRIDQFLKDNKIPEDLPPDRYFQSHANYIYFNNFGSLNDYVRSQPTGFRGILDFGRQRWHDGLIIPGHKLNVVSRGNPVYIDLSNHNILQVRNSAEQAAHLNTETASVQHMDWRLFPTGFVRHIPYPQNRPPSLQEEQQQILQYQQQQDHKRLQNQHLQNPYLQNQHVQYLLKHLENLQQQNHLQNPYVQHLLQHLENPPNLNLENIQDPTQARNVLQSLQNPHLQDVLTYLQNPPEQQNLLQYLQIPLQQNLQYQQQQQNPDLEDALEYIQNEQQQLLQNPQAPQQQQNQPNLDLDDILEYIQNE